MTAQTKKKRGSKETAMADQTTVNEDENMVHEVMENNLDLMLEVIHMIENDPAFAKNIYANCPRLQHLLDQQPDLRPIFEDPKLVLINFKQVYRKAGGVFPEDRPSRCARILTCIVKSPLFKVLSFLLLIKKCYSCIMGGGVAMIRTVLVACCTGEGLGEAADVLDVDDMEEDGDDRHNKHHESNRAALYEAADRMEDPEMQEKLNRILDSDPDQLEELIEQDPELKALRDSNPLCGELLSDPDTARILTDPDNLRALADSPDLIEQDFNDPNWTPPDVENGEFDDGGGDDEGGVLDEYEHGEESGNVGGEGEEGEILEDFEHGEDSGNVGGDGDEGGVLDEYEPGDDSGSVGGEGDEGGVLDEYEPGEESGNVGGDGDEGGVFDEYEPGEESGNVGDAEADGFGEFEGELEPELEPDTDAGDQKGRDAPDTTSPSSNKGSKRRTAEGQQQNRGAGGVFISSIAAGVVDYIAAETVGMTVSEVIGGDDPLESAVEAQEDAAEEAAGTVTEVVEEATGNEMVDNVEDTMDTIEDSNDLLDSHNTSKVATGSAAAEGAVVGAAVGSQSKASATQDAEAKAASKKRVAKAGSKLKNTGTFLGAALATAAKEFVAGAVLGEDFGEDLVERMEEGGNNSDDEDESSSNEEKDKQKKERKGLFSRKRNE